MREFKDVKLGYFFQYEGKNYIKCKTFGWLNKNDNSKVVTIFNCVEPGTGETFYLPDTVLVETKFDKFPDEDAKELKYTRSYTPREKEEKTKKDKEFLKRMFGNIVDNFDF